MAAEVPGVAITWPDLDAPAGEGWARRDGAGPAAESLQVWLRACARSGWAAPLGTESAGIALASGRVTAGAVRALWSVPAHRAAAMDGIAVSAADTRAATPERPTRLPPGEFDVIDTGDLMPDGRDAVIMREHLRHLGDGSVEISNAVAPGRHVRSPGEDIRAGTLLLPAGHRVRPVDVAALAGAGHRTIAVRRRPVVAILPTGDEVRPVGSVPAPGEVLDTNSLMLAGMAGEAGGEVLALPIVPDQPDVIATAVARVARRADVVLVIAGSSAGRGDHTAAVVRRLGHIAVQGVAIRPGHPVLLGVLSGDRPVPVVGVPGYPGSAERAFTCFVLPLLNVLLGITRSEQRYSVPARLACPVSSAPHLEEYLRLRLARVLDPRTGREDLVAVPLRRGAGALNTIIQTEALLRIPIGISGVAAGAEVAPIPLGGAAFETATTIIAGPRSPAADALLEESGARGVVQWIESSAREASEALATGLCHVAALGADDALAGGPGDFLAALAERIGKLATLRISAREALVLPALAWDSSPVMVLRGALLATREAPES
ncbi:MAG TPA: molybdopterin-binding protein [Pseudonocardiaceae bacterium]|nr:molybdopterin-binding protein [Pseudonocardiaceae bacterium]